MKAVDSFLFQAALWECEPQFTEARGLAVLDGYDDDLAVWAGSPSRLLDVKAYATAISWIISLNDDDEMRETFWPLWKACVAEQPDLAPAWDERTISVSASGRVIWIPATPRY